MKNYLPFILFLLMVLGKTNAQTSEDAKKTIEEFFIAFHKQDTTALKALAYTDINMHSISTDKEGNTVLHNMPYWDFLKSIASIPESTKFEERLTGYEVQSDGKMANVWTPYLFFLNDKMSHCGVNNFQLISIEGTWKIFYIVDTRSTENCK
tara:strand:+ start:275 stop:730 length:456 start_codon:yes stop_codon:yes gene_type:complete